MRFVLGHIYDMVMVFVDLYLETKENWRLRDRTKQEEELNDWEKEHFE